MVISTVKCCEKIFNHPDLSKIMGVPTYEILHLLHNEINSKAMGVHSNIGGGKHGYLWLVVIPIAYAPLTNTPIFHQLHPGNLIIPIAATHHAQEELKRHYEKNYKSSTKHEDWNER